MIKPFSYLNRPVGNRPAVKNEFIWKNLVGLSGFGIVCIHFLSLEGALNINNYFTLILPVDLSAYRGY